MQSKISRVNRFSKQYYLYPEEMREAERRYQEQLKELKEQQKIEEKSQKALIMGLEKKHKQDINEVLEQRGFTLSNLPSNAEWLPIYIFDDKKYDLHSPSEWLSIYNSPNEKVEFKGSALVKDNQHTMKWKSVIVRDYNPKSEKWIVDFEDGTQDEIFRINLVFNCEDKNIFSTRFIQAYSERVFLDSFIRYNFYIDSMPSNNMGKIPHDFILHILNKSRNSKKLKSKEIVNDKILTKTIESFYFRTCNKILFNDQLNKQKDVFALKHQLILSDELLTGNDRKDKGLVVLSRNYLKMENKEQSVVFPSSMNFNETFKLFCLNSIFNKKQILKIFKEIEDANKKVLSLNMFDCNFGESVTFENFRNSQESMATKFMNHCKINWIKDVVSSVTKNLKDENSGWFNLRNISTDNYSVGKLKSLLSAIDLKLADVLRKIIETNYSSFILSFIKECPVDVKIHSTCHVENIYLDDNHQNTSKPPLFLIQVKFDETRILFPEIPSLFSELIILLVTKSLEELARFNKIEDQILKNSLDHKRDFFIRCPTLTHQSFDELSEKLINKSPRPSNYLIGSLVSKLKTKLSTVIQPASLFVEYYKQLDSELSLTPSEYASKYESANKNYTVSNLLEEIEKLKNRESELLKQFPEDIQVSIFKFDNTDVRTRIKENSAEIEKAIYRLIEEKGKSLTNDLLTKSLKSLKSKLKEKPRTVEEMTAISDYLDNQLMEELTKIHDAIDEIRGVYAVLEENKIKVASEDMKRFWMVVGGPKEIMDAKKLLQLDFQTLKNTFEKELTADQLKFEVDVEAIKRSLESFNKNHDLGRCDEIFHDASMVNDSLQELLRKSNLFNSREILLKKKPTDYGFVGELERNFKPLFNLWKVVSTWNINKNLWMKDHWNTVDAVGAEAFSTEGLSVIASTLSFLNDSNKKLFDRLIKNTQVVKKEIEDFSTKVPLLVALKREGMQDRHWDLISTKLGVDINPSKTEAFNFEYVLSLKVLNHKAFCIDIGEKASRENEIDKSLKKMFAKWESIEIETATFKREDLFIVKTFDKVETELDEDFSTTNGMLINPFREPFEKDISQWNEQLLLISNVIEEWRKLQFQWAYLQPIFDSQDISRQLPAESNLFKKADQFYRQFLISVNKIKNMISISKIENLLEKIAETNSDLESIQKELNNYLEVKRGKFARFYFLSNDELLSILSETKEVTKIQNHLRKVFENLGSLVFNEKLQIVGMSSLEGETVSFSTVVNPLTKQVEDWMTDVEIQMTTSMKRELNDSVKDYNPDNKNQWILSHPGQCVLNGFQIIWTHDVEEAVANGSLESFVKKMKELLLSVVVMNRQGMSSMNLITLEALIVIEVHALDVVMNLIKSGIKDIGAFEWISQLRYYLVNETCKVRCIQTDFAYGYEYLGNTSRLVITPLTDKCYMTLMGALKLNLGGAPAGPAGTGKTETTKDLAKALAKQCVVFNCQESMDYLFLSKFFKGLASSGAWCCFDEFNRINIEVLSVIAQQLQDLFRAKSERVKEMRFEDTIIKVEPTFSVYITMNPGYAGRTELPDNLKALFRPVAMMVPDYALIAEIKLYSFGFTQAKELSQKMVDTFKLSSEQLSNQKHYDYGMRAVTSVINAAGLFKQLHGDKEGMSEDQLLYKALLDVNVPKFLSDDIPLFANIVKDLFPGLVALDQRNLKLNDALAISCRNFNLQPKPRFIEKTLQLYDTIQVRHGLMLVGPTGGGKTSSQKALQNAINLMSVNDSKVKPVKTELISPKSMTLSELYGESKDLNWKEGVIEIVMEKAISESADECRWVMFDGPVDAVWIESMNTVLDDNKKLCLASGKVLILTPNIVVMFEVEDLLVASPATVSRCGMVYIDTEGFDLECLLDSYLNMLPDEISGQSKFREDFIEHFNTIFKPALIYHSRNSQLDIFDVSDVIVLQGFLRLFDSCISSVKTSLSPEGIEGISQSLRDLIVFCTIWSVGCLGEAKARNHFESYFTKNVLKNNDLSEIFEKEFDLSSRKWIPWNAAFSKFEIPPSTPFHEIVIPTMDFTRGVRLCQLLAFNKMNVLIPGNVGSGKTICVFRLLSDYMNKDFNSLSLAFSAQTTPKQLCDYFLSQIEKRRKGVFGPKNGKKVVIFLDDINMPIREEWGAQPPLELLRQYLDHGAWHIIKMNKEYVKIEDVVIVGAMVPPRAGRNDLSRRLVRHFNILPFTDFDQKVTQSIYEQVLCHFLCKKRPEAKLLIPDIISACIEVFKTTCSQLLPTPAKSHYIFNLRDLAKTVHGLTSLEDSPDPKKSIWQLWFHENERAYSDRLSEIKDIDKLKSSMVGVLTKFSGFQISDINADKDLIFSSLPGGSYYLIDSPNDLISSVERLLEKFNADSLPKNQMKLVMFLDFCKIVSRLSKVLKNPQGHVLLLGVGGSGRQSLSRLSVYATSLKAFTIEPTKGYNLQKWKEDLKRLYLTAVCDNQQLGFILSDAQITNESFLEDVNALLNTGLVVGLPFLPEESKRLDDVGRTICQSKSLQPNKMNLMSCQIGVLKQNLHLLISMSPGHDKFSQRLRMFPSLVNCCSLNWMHKWPEEALIGVATQYLKQQLQLDNIDDSVVFLKSAHRHVEELSIEFYQSTGRVNHLTSASYLELLGGYKRVFQSKNLELKEQLNRFESGVHKLFEANKQVEDIRDHLRNEEPKLKTAEVEVRELLEKVAKDKETENETKKVVALEEAEAAAQQLEANALKKSAEESVRIANDELAKTLEKIQLLKPSNIIEIRTANNPFKKMKLVASALCYLLLDSNTVPGLLKKQITEDEFWVLARNNLFNDPSKLFNCLMTPETKDSIEPSRFKKVSEIVKKNPDLWNDKEMKNSSLANYYLYLWVECVLNYTEINEKTKPIRDQLEKVTKELEEKTVFLEKKKEELDASTKRLKELEDLFTEKLNLKEELFRRINECNIKLERASKLTTLLEDETGRWQSEIVKISDQLKLVANDSLVVACQLSYFGPFDSLFRTKMEAFLEKTVQKLGLKISDGLKMASFLSNPIEILNWGINGLPKDESSLINGILMHRSQRWPLIIDPQGRGVKFIKNVGKTLPVGLEVIKASSGNLLRQLEQAIQIGKWVLLENLGLTIDPLLEPILLQKIFTVSGGKVLSLGDKMIPFNENFKFLMTTSLPNPAYSPEVFARSTVINFCLTLTGLEEHLWAQIMLFENKELENKKTEIVIVNADDKQHLKEIEDNILASLRESKGDVLMDESLIMRLTQAKKTFTEINNRIAEATITEREIDEVRVKYKDGAYLASHLYFLVSEMLSVDSMYQYSLQWFEALFQSTLEKSNPSGDIPVRLENIKDHFLYALFEGVCVSLYDKHKLLFSFLITIKRLQAYSQLDEEKWSFLISGSVEEFKNEFPKPEYISESAWPRLFRELSGINKLNNCQGILDSFLQDSESWKVFYLSNDPENSELPGDWDSLLDDFDKLLILKALRLDKLINGIQKFIQKKMGNRFIETPIIKLEDVFQSSSAIVPLVFMVSSGSDPKADFDSLSMKNGIKSIGVISLGQGQGPKAEKLIKEASKAIGEGGWVLLQNCHLSISWLPKLESICEEFTLETVHPDFRLWMTTMPCSAFPVSILRNSKKMTIEPPKSFKANLKITYNQLDNKILDSCVNQPENFRKLLFGLSIFHAVVQERRKYGSIGWNIPYEFTREDFLVCRRQLQSFLDDYTQIPFKVLTFVFGEINYGGRVTDDKDTRLIDALAKAFVNEKVLETGFRFTNSELYYSIDGKYQGDYLSFIEGLPIHTSPEIMGLHGNSEIMTNQNEAETLLKLAKSINPNSVNNSMTDGDSGSFALIAAIKSKIPKPLDLNLIKRKFPVVYEDSLNTVLAQEAIKFNELIDNMIKSMDSLKLAVEGLIALSFDLEQVLIDLKNYTVPKLWSQTFLSLKPLFSWLDELNQRLSFFDNWTHKGTPNSFWFNAFSFPQAFLTGILQNFARKTKTAIDKLEFEFKMMGKSEFIDNLNTPDVGVFIHGIFVEGARWNFQSDKLDEALPNELFSKMPVVWLVPGLKKSRQSSGTYRCPLYKTLTRSGTLTTTGHSSNFVMMIDLECLIGSDHWVRRGAACFLALKD